MANFLRRQEDHKLEAERRIVRTTYAKFGVGSPEFEEASAKLHQSNLLSMAAIFRREHDLAPNAVTPYS